MRKIFTLLLSTLLIFSMLPQAFAATSFTDVPRSHWAYEAIMDMADRGIISGYNDRTFRPDNKITRAEFAKIMIAAADIDIDRSHSVSQTFKDVSKRHWAFYYVELAKSYLTGYKSGSSYLYKPDEYAVREDIAVALVRLMGYDRTQNADLDLLDNFRDEDDISKALRPYIALAIKNELIKGFNDRTFRPLAPITRAEAASLLYRANLDETKVVFPPTTEPKPEPPKPPQGTTITDSFTDSKLSSNWKTGSSLGTWGVYNKTATAFTFEKDLDHLFLPLNWEKSDESQNYEMQVDVLAKGTDGLGGLYISGKDDDPKVIYVEKGKLTVGTVKDANSSEVKVLTQVSYKLQSTNKLKVVVKDSSFSIYLNGNFVFEQKDQLKQPTTVGLYLQRKSGEGLPEKGTFFDNFSFKALTR
ncbi:S-layer homology domain-containing protein [Brevibacillus sp. SYSU BS000544]|uniref:S-layer homology domain-containing protein n=1 Tax=Brevibacillus sp. SYSU BS000544 TaxID=3416443 RepID=UPI003CE48352